VTITQDTECSSDDDEDDVTITQDTECSSDDDEDDVTITQDITQKTAQVNEVSPLSSLFLPELFTVVFLSDKPGTAPQNGDATNIS
jgi:hypothetical protein